MAWLKMAKAGRPQLQRKLELVDGPGVYILYRDDIPYYVGQANRLRKRLWAHASVPGARYYNFWNFFSAFVIRSDKLRNAIEAILIAAMPTANSAKPRLQKAKFPPAVSKMSRDIYQLQANPKLEFEKLTRLLRKIRESQEQKRKVR